MLSPAMFLACFLLLTSAETITGQLAPYANGTCVDKRPQNTSLVVRRNLTSLSGEDVLRLRRVFKRLQELDGTKPEKNCTYFNVAKHHGWFTATCQHETTTCFQHGFLPWHRVYMYEMEQAMRTIDPNVSLPYWDFTSVYSESPKTPVQDLLPSMVTERYYDDPATKRTEFNPLYTYTIPSIPGADASPPSPINISRNTGPELGHLDKVRSLICSAFRQGHYDVFSRQYECPHNLMHVLQGGFIAEYSSTSQRWAAYDPLFWFYHANIDRIWAGWEKNNDDFTSVYVSRNDTFYPFFDWTFEQVTKYEQTMYYTYDNTFTTNFCNSRLQAGRSALFAQFTQLPVAHDGPYAVRLIVDHARLLNRSAVNTTVNENNIAAEIGMWHAMPNNCMSPNCNAWCHSPVSLPSHIADNLHSFLSKPFNVSDTLYVDVYGPNRNPIDLSSGIDSSYLRQFLENREAVIDLPLVEKPQLAYGRILSNQEYLDSVQVSDDKTNAFISWHPLSPDSDEYPPIQVEAGANLTFNYYAADHSVAQVFENEFKQCGPGFIMPQCLPQPGNSGLVNCIIRLPPQATNTTFFFICTQQDHCGTRGMRLRVKVGNGLNVRCSNYQSPECNEPQCPANAVCRPQGGGKYPNGTVIIYSCKGGYQLDGYPSIQCLDHSLWTSTPPTCISGGIKVVVNAAMVVFAFITHSLVQ